jgi:hypothetical protein
MKQIRKEINQPLYVPQMAQQKTGMVTLGGYTEGFAKSRFEMIRKSEEKALKLRQFHERKAAESAQGGFKFGGVAKKAFGAAGLAAGFASDALGADSATGKAMGAIGNIGGAAAMGGMVGGPFGAAVFGGAAALKEFTTAINDAEKKVRESKIWAAEQVASAVGRRQEVVEEVKSLRQQFFPDKEMTESEALREMQEKSKATKRLIESGEKSGFNVEQIDALRQQRRTMLGEIHGFMRDRDFRDSGAQGLQALFQSRGAIGETAMQFGQQGLGMVGAGIGRIRENLFEGTRLQQLSQRQELMDRMRMLVRQPNTLGSPLAMRGTNEYLQSISDQPKAEQDLEAIAKTAREQLAEEKKQTAALEKAAIAAQEQITVNM